MRLAALILYGAMVLPAASAQAAGGQVAWPTFFRTGPSRHTPVVAEMSRGTVVDVRSCDDRWCLVQYGRAVGYVERAALDTNAFPPLAAPLSVRLLR